MNLRPLSYYLNFRIPVHKAMEVGNTNITLTAHVLISLEEVTPILQVRIFNFINYNKKIKFFSHNYTEHFYKVKLKTKGVIQSVLWSVARCNNLGPTS